MAVSEQYRRQAVLLVRTIPLVAEETCFALKGGTAINLFVRDMPRLSVDIDLTYLPIADRATSLSEINAAMLRLADRIRAGIRGAEVSSAKLKGENIINKHFVEQGGVQIKIEVTPVLRGCWAKKLIGSEREMATPINRFCRSSSISPDQSSRYRRKSGTAVYSILHSLFPEVGPNLAEISLHRREHFGDIVRQPAFSSQGLKRSLPIRRRRRQLGLQLVCPSSVEGQPQGNQNPLLIQFTRSNQESQVHQVLHPAVRGVARKRIGMDLLSELLFAGNHLSAHRFDSSEPQPVPADDRLQRLHNNITNAGIEVEPSKDPPVHSGFDWKTGAAIRRSGQIQDRRPNRVFEPIAERSASSILQHLPDDLIRILRFRPLYSLQREIDVNR